MLNRLNRYPLDDAPEPEPVESLGASPVRCTPKALKALRNARHATVYRALNRGVNAAAIAALDGKGLRAAGGRPGECAPGDYVRFVHNSERGIWAERSLEAGMQVLAGQVKADVEAMLGFAW